MTTHVSAPNSSTYCLFDRRRSEERRDRIGTEKSKGVETDSNSGSGTDTDGEEEREEEREDASRASGSSEAEWSGESADEWA